MAQVAQRAGLAGLEFLIGIPGTIGGAVRMNAGAFGGETKDRLLWAEALDRRGELHRLTPADLGFTYRHSALPADWIVDRAAVPAASRASPTRSLARMDAIRAEREAAQPLRVATGGSTFKNPPGHKAWQLIDAAGCRGLRLGAAMVSEKHCNFLINTGGATAAEIEQLGELVRQRVREHSGVELEWEVDPGRPRREPGAGGMTRHVAVLMGGRSAEREVSLVSGEACARALEERGYRVTRIDAGRRSARGAGAGCGPTSCSTRCTAASARTGASRACSTIWRFPTPIRACSPRRWPWTSRWPSACSRSAGLRCPEGVETTLARARWPSRRWRRPFVVKPAAEGSSVGVVDRARRRSARRSPTATISTRDCRLLVERYVPGRELTCAVLGDEPLAVTEIRPNEGFYDYRAKYTEGFAVHLVPAPLSPDALRAGDGLRRCGRIACSAAAASAAPTSASTRARVRTASISWRSTRSRA